MTGNDLSFGCSFLTLLWIYLIVCGVIANLIGAIYLIGWIIKHVHIS